MRHELLASSALLALLLPFAASAASAQQDCGDCDDNGVPESVEQSTPNGLVAQYWRSQGAGNFTERLAARIDPEINFNWAGGSPDPAVPTNEFAARWTGVLTPPVTGTYTFYTTTDDGVRLWVNGQYLINKWQPQSSAVWSATIPLVAGQKVFVRMDYYEGGGDAVAKLEWQAPGIARQIVPTSAFSPLSDLSGDGWPDSCADCDGDGVTDGEAFANGTASDCNGNCIPDACEIGQTATIGYWRFETGGATVPDSGPNNLAGSPSGVLYTGSVATTVIPATAEANTRAADLGAAGRVTVADPGNLLASGGESFTIEAWVRVDQLAAGATAADRHVIVQRKALASGDKFADYIFFAQGGDMPTTGIANYGRTGNFNGRELVLLFGNGGTASSSFWTVTSNLRIEDSGWHYVAVAFDAGTGTVRFTRDATTESFTVVDLGHVSVSGPLLIGAHTNSSGAYNQPLVGAIDELRVSAGFLDAALLLSRTGSSDCNGNGEPDSCDIASGISGDCNRDGIPNECEPDCNGNGAPDGCDIAGGFSADCNDDGIPDDCQLVDNDCDGDGIPDDCQLPTGDCNANDFLDRCEIAAGTVPDCNDDGVIDTCQFGDPLTYRIDDGGGEFGIRSAGSHMAWLTSFRVEQGAGLIEELEMNFVFMPTGATVTVGVWSDPNGDGNPADAQLLTSLVTPTAPLGVYRRIDIPDVDVGPTGTSFFVGAYTPVGTNDFPAPLDTSGNAILGRCWVLGYTAPVDPNDLTANAEEFELIEQALFPGKWLIRAIADTTVFDCNGNGVLDSCDIEEGTSADSDASGIPDECEDCNGNGVLDSTDIAAGTSVDCQDDGIPDECQVGGTDCNADGIPDDCQLDGNDCNGNGTLDSCDVASGASDDANSSGIPDECEDCNRNQIFDDVDILFGTSLDCNLDGVPDECQLGEPPADVEYKVDDGTREGNYGAGGVVDFIWLNRFTVEAGGEWIGRIRVILGNAFAGTPYRVALWNDPDGNGQPNDSQVIVAVDALAANGNTNVFNEIEIPPTFIGPAGTSFFAGVIYRDSFGNQFPLAIDNNSTPNQKSWVAIGDPVDPNNLSAATLYGYLANDNALVRADGFDGELPFDCNANGIPDDCDIADGTLPDANGDGIPDCCDVGRGCGPCAPDFNGDGVVNAQDLAALLGGWGGAAGDLNGDGVTNAQDLAALLGAWGPCGP
jgi:hypothetical protein